MIEAIALTPEDEDIGARTIVGEASDQGQIGMIAVAWALRNRLAWSAWWGKTVAAACKYPYQFSCWLGGKNTDRITQMQPTDSEYIAALAVLRAVFAGEIEDTTGGSTTYKVRGTKASWDHAVATIAPRAIGSHDFWRLSPYGTVLAFNDQPTTQVA